MDNIETRSETAVGKSDKFSCTFTSFSNLNNRSNQTQEWDIAKFRSQNVLPSKALQIFVNRNNDYRKLLLTELLPRTNVLCVITHRLSSGQSYNNLGGKL
jgi:hypothetical protein